MGDEPKISLLIYQTRSELPWDKVISGSESSVLESLRCLKVIFLVFTTLLTSVE